jgi:hypothetical protein
MKPHVTPATASLTIILREVEAAQRHIEEYLESYADGTADPYLSILQSEKWPDGPTRGQVIQKDLRGILWQFEQMEGVLACCIPAIADDDLDAILAEAADSPAIVG